jgi:pyruvate kinase
MKKKIDILCTLGPSSLNKKFLIFSKNNISLLRLNMSHVSLAGLEKLIKFIRKYTSTPICVDTEGAQIRTKVKKSKFFKVNSTFLINKKAGNINLYPEEVFDKLKFKDELDIGFNDLKAKIIEKKENYIKLKTISSGLIEKNKGVHVVNRIVNLNYLTKKDLKAIQISRRLNIKNFALSFTNTEKDIKQFNKILPRSNKIFKIETIKAVKSLDKLMKLGSNFLIDRGDLSKEVSIEQIPVIQRKIISISKKYRNKKIFIDTNFLESMIENKYPTRGEANDIYSSLEMGANGLVLAAETAIGKFPEKTIIFLKKMIKTFSKES